MGTELDGTVFLGELSLDGSLRPVRGLLPILISAKARGFTTFVIPAENAGEARFLDGVTVYPFSSLTDVVKFLVGAERPAPVKPVKYVPGEGRELFRFKIRQRSAHGAARGGDRRRGRA